MRLKIEHCTLLLELYKENPELFPNRFNGIRRKAKRNVV